MGDSVSESGKFECTEEVVLSTDADIKQSEDGCFSNILGRKFDDEIGEYYFESDQLSLKGNVDYLNLLRTVTLLEAQRIKAIKDLDRLAEAEKEALADPISFVEKLQRNENLDLPGLQPIAEIPIIDWDKYTSNFTLLSELGHHHMTRHKKNNVAEPLAFSSGSDGGAVGAEVKTETDDSSSSRTFRVRGRVFNMGKPQSFNQLWSVEEQKRLEEFLIKFPPEEVEARRWEKIAKALGNRTPQQVASRVQKYFIKLTKAKLPVPGRIPNMATYTRKSGIHHRQHRHNRFLFQPSTFLASYEPPVFMSEMDDDTSSSYNFSPSSSVSGDQGFGSQAASFGVPDKDDIPVELHNTEEYKQLLFLERLRRKRMQEQGGYQHTGYKCDRCDCEPIAGTRWHCINCPPDNAVDLCENCVNSNFENGTHLSDHCLEPVQLNQGYIDDDYTQFLRDDYNYLDPNYMPAS